MDIFAGQAAPRHAGLARGARGAPRALRRDEFGDWRISSSHACAYADCEGSLILNRLPTATEVEIIRRRIGIKRRRHLSDDALAELRSRDPAKSGLRGSKTAVEEVD
jgi:hypothetical protein